MHFTLWPSVTGNEGGHTELSWASFVGFVASPVVAADKFALEGWSPARFRGNTRKADLVELVSAITLDDDKSGLPLDRVVELWSRFAGAAHSSHSHTDAAPKWRIILRTSRPMTGAEHARVWSAVRDLAVSRGQPIDEATRDPSRLWFVPGHREGAPYAWAELPGAPIDVDAVLANVPMTKGPTVLPPAQPLTAPAARPLAAAAAAAAAALRISWPPKGRHQAQLALAGALRSEGWSPADAVDLLEAVAGDRPKREATVRHTWALPEDAPRTGWTRLKAFVDPVVVSAVRKLLDGTAAIEARMAAAAPIGSEPANDFLGGLRAKDPRRRVTLADAFRMRREQGPLVREPTAIAALDQWTSGGLPYGTTIAVIGAPDVAKTLLLFQIAHAYAQRGIAVGFYSIDEEIGDLHTRIVQRTPIDGQPGSPHYSRVDYERGSSELIERMEQIVGELRLFYYDDRWTVEDAAADLDAYARSLGLRAAFFIDSVQTCTCNALRSMHEPSERRQVTENAKAIRSIAIQYRMITVFSSESNREFSKGKRRGENPSAMTAGAESRAIEFKSRAVLALSPTGDPDVIEVGIPKNKLGRRAEPAFYLHLDKERQELTDVAAPEQAEKLKATPRQEARRQEAEGRRLEIVARRVREREDASRRKTEQAVRDAEVARGVLEEMPDATYKDRKLEVMARLAPCGKERAEVAIAIAKKSNG